MKRYKKSLLIFGFLIMMVPVYTSADSQPHISTLVLGDNSYVLGQVRNFASGNHILDMSIDSWYTTCSANPNKTSISLYTNDMRRLTGFVANVYVKSSLYKNLGTFDSGPKRYQFSSRFGDNYYCGYRSNYVAMYPKQS